MKVEDGEVQVNHNWFLGYTKDENKHLIIDPEQAVVVKRIFREYLEGKSLGGIAKGLMADGIFTAANKPMWRADGIRKILTNEKYIGDALLQKTYTVDVLNKKRVVNNGIVPQYYVENDHEAIIPREIFMQVQGELARRSHYKSNKNGDERIYSSKYALSSRLYCGKCGDTMRRIMEQNKVKKYIKWKCSTKVHKGVQVCSGNSVSEKEIQNAVVRAINKTLRSGENVLEDLQKNVEDTLENQLEEEYKEVSLNLTKIQEELISRANSNKNYDDIADAIKQLRRKQQELLIAKSEHEGVKDRIDEMRAFLQQQTTRIDKYDEQLVIKLINKITVYDDKFVFEFKSGMILNLRI